MCVCVGECVSESVCVCVCERKSVCVCVCVREKERVCVCENVKVCVSVCVCSTGMLWGRPGVGIPAAHRCCVSVFAADVWREFCATRSRVCPAWRRSSRPDPAADAVNSL